MKLLNRRNFLRTTSATLAFALAKVPKLAYAKDSGVEIASLPFNITQPGRYILNRSLTYLSNSGAAISVNASNVIIDLNGYSIARPNADLNAAVGIGINSGSNVTVKNGTLRYFYAGVYSYLCGGSVGNHLAERLRIIAPLAAGVVFRGPNCIVRECSISALGGESGPRNPSGSVGIALLGQEMFTNEASGGEILDNDIAGFCTAANHFDTIGVMLFGDSNTVGNRLSNLRFNAITNFSSATRWQNNLTSNVTRNYIFGEDLGGNN